MRSSAELMASSGAVILLERDRRVVLARRVELVEHVVGVDAVAARRASAARAARRRRRASGASFCACTVDPAISVEDLDRALEAGRLRRVVAALPRRVVADAVHEHLAPHPVAARDLRRHAGERHQAVHEVGVGLAPHPRLHAAHRRAHHELEVVDLQPLGHQPVLRRHHVRVGVARETARAGRRSACCSARGRCRRAGSGSASARRAAARARTARRRSSRLRNCCPVPPVPWRMRTAFRTTPLRVAPGLAERHVVQLQFRQRLAGREAEVADDEIAGHRRKPRGGRGLGLGGADTGGHGNGER